MLSEPPVPPSTPEVSASKGASEAVRAYKRGARRIVALTIMLAVAGFFAFGQIRPHYTSLEFVGFGVLMFVPIAFVEAMLISRQNARLLDVLTEECDPQKMLEIVRQLRGGFFKRQPITNPYIECICLLDLDRTDEARAVLPHVSFKANTRAVQLNKLGLAVAFARLDDDVAELSRLRAEGEKIVANPKCTHDELAAAQTTLASIDFHLALDQNDFAGAEEAVGRLRANATCRRLELACTYRAARLAEAEGKTDEARGHYEAVAAASGTMAIIGLSQDWLAEHA